MEGAEHRLEVVTVGGAADIESLCMQAVHTGSRMASLSSTSQSVLPERRYSARRLSVDRSGELKPQLALQLPTSSGNSYRLLVVTATAF